MPPDLVKDDVRGQGPVGVRGENRCGDEPVHEVGVCVTVGSACRWPGSRDDLLDVCWLEPGSAEQFGQEQAPLGVAWASKVNSAAARRRTAGSRAPGRLVHSTMIVASFGSAVSMLMPRMSASTPARSSWCICAASRDWPVRRLRADYQYGGAAGGSFRASVTMASNAVPIRRVVLADRAAAA